MVKLHCLLKYHATLLIKIISLTLLIPLLSYIAFNIVYQKIKLYCLYKCDCESRFEVQRDYPLNIQNPIWKWKDEFSTPVDLEIYTMNCSRIM